MVGRGYHMDQYKEMEKYLYEYRKNRKADKKDSLDNNKAGLLLIQYFEKVLETLIQRQMVNQKIGKQDKIKYLVFQRLLSSGYTGSYEISIGMSNAKLYLDEQIVYEYWKPDFFYEDIDKAMEEVKKILGKKYVRIEEYELMRLKQQLLLDDWNLFVEILKRGAQKISQSVIESDLILEDEVQVLYGNYMDKLHIAYKIRTCIEEENNG